MAHVALDRGIHRQACFHGQQAVEKVLKAFLLVRRGTYPKSHSLEQLLLFDAGDELAAWRNRCRSLDQFYLPTRYADAVPEGAAAEPTAEEARAAVEAAEGIVADVRQRLLGSS